MTQAAPPTAADPVLSASLYCHGRLDEAVRQVLVPLGRRECQPGSGVGMWWLRYARGGEHLKLRLRAPARSKADLRRTLGELAEGFVARLQPAPEDERIERLYRIPLDSADRPRRLHADRALEWTEYFRSPVCLGGPPWIHDDAFVEGLVGCLEAAGQLALQAFDGDGPMDLKLRQNLFLEGLIAGLAGVGEELRVPYLRHHRDELLRFTAARAGGDAEKALERLAHIDRQARAMAPLYPVLARLADAAWGGDDGGEPLAAATARLAAELGSRGAAGDLPKSEPFAAEPLFTPLFKTFHVLANQAGLSPSWEAFCIQVLLRALGADQAAQRATLLPGVVAGTGDMLHRKVLEGHPMAAGWAAWQGRGDGDGEVAEEAEDGFDAPDSVLQVHEWPHFVGLAGEEGKRWLKEFHRDTNRRWIDSVQAAFVMMRGRRLDEAQEALATAEANLAQLETEPGLYQMHVRRLHGALAYLYYVLGDMERASESVDAGRAAIVRAMDLDRRLLPAATDILESVYQHLRIERNRQRWDAMAERVASGRRMLDGTDPLCVLADGSRIDLDTVAAHFRTLPPLSPAERESVRGLFDPEYRFYRFYRLVWKIYAFPGQAIPFP